MPETSGLLRRLKRPVANFILLPIAMLRALIICLPYVPIVAVASWAGRMEDLLLDLGPHTWNSLHQKKEITNKLLTLSSIVTITVQQVFL